MATAKPTSGLRCAWSASSVSWCPRPGLLHLRIGGAPDFSGGQRRHPRAAGRSFVYHGFGPVGANLFLVALLLISTTLATGLSWLTVMDKIGAVGARAGPLFRRSTQQAAEWQQARALREEREERARSTPNCAPSARR
jgi:S-DNA-T family DNA segregation ATPase FtsK/SpoIIIE